MTSKEITLACEIVSWTKIYFLLQELNPIGTTLTLFCLFSKSKKAAQKKKIKIIFNNSLTLALSLTEKFLFQTRKILAPLIKKKMSQKTFTYNFAFNLLTRFLSLFSQNLKNRSKEYLKKIWYRIQKMLSKYNNILSTLNQLLFIHKISTLKHLYKKSPIYSSILTTPTHFLLYLPIMATMKHLTSLSRQININLFLYL